VHALPHPGAWENASALAVGGGYFFFCGFGPSTGGSDLM
jgi:hypothetical protein